MSPWTLRRRAARVVLLDPAGRVFLMEARDPADPSKGAWWEIPGGGIDPGESTEQAALRELHEETGISGAEIGPCVWVQHVEFDFGGWHFDQDEFIHIARVEGGDYDPQGLEHLEHLAFSAGRWWSLDELIASDVRLLPARLRELLPPLIAGDLPLEPIDIGALG
jgi:8-oxo-dGTP pyrophosphatase MutT (NUDIX family)